MRIVISLFCCLLFVGCASTVEKVSDDASVNIAENMGYVLLPVYRNTHIHQIRLSGKRYIKFDSSDLNASKSYLLVTLPIGEYTFDEIRLNKYTVVSDFDEEGNSDLWSFSVSAGVINYTGHFVVTNHSRLWGRYNLSYEIQNNASVALEYLEKNYPNITKKYDITYSGPGTDDFFSYADSLSSNEGGLK